MRGFEEPFCGRASGQLGSWAVGQLDSWTVGQLDRKIILWKAGTAQPKLKFEYYNDFEIKIKYIKNM